MSDGVADANHTRARLPGGLRRRRIRLEVAPRGDPKERLDKLIVEHNVAPTRSKAQAYVLAGEVQVDGAPAPKPGMKVASTLRSRCGAAAVRESGRLQAGWSAGRLRD